MVAGDGGQLAQDAGQADRVGFGERAEELGQRRRIPDRAGSDMAFSGHSHVNERRLYAITYPRLEQLGTLDYTLGQDFASSNQARRKASDGRLADGWKRVVGSSRERQHRHLASCRRRDPGGTVTAKADDHTRAYGDHAPDGVHRVLRGLPDRLAVEKLDLRPPAVLTAAPPDRAKDRRRDAAEVSAEQYALHADRIERSEHALDHVGLLGRREHRGLRNQAPDVATGQRVRYNPDDRITHSNPPPGLTLRAHPRNGNSCCELRDPPQR